MSKNERKIKSLIQLVMVNQKTNRNKVKKKTFSVTKTEEIWKNKK